MVADPASAAIGYVLMGASGPASSLVNRVMQHWVPTPLEEAQIKNIHDSLALARERLAQEQERADKQLAHARESLLIQLKHQDEVYINETRRRTWPLPTIAADIIRDSRTTARATRRLPLTVILKLSAGPKSEQLASASHHLDGSVRTYFKENILFYAECREPAREAGHALAATFHGSLETEPTALIAISIPEPSVICVDLSYWGWAIGGSASAIDHASRLLIDIPPGEQDPPRLIEAALLHIIAGIHDSFQTLMHLGDPPPLRMFQVLKALPTTSVRIDADEWSKYKDVSCETLLIETHAGTLDRIADRAPFLAAAAAARAGLDAFASGRTEAAQSFVERALDYCQRGSSVPTDVIIQQIMSGDRGGKDGPLPEALSRIIGIKRSELLGKKLSLVELARLANKEL